MDHPLLTLLGFSVLTVYGAALLLLTFYGVHRYWILYFYFKNRRKTPPLPSSFDPLPMVTVQLPIFNERYVVRRLIDAVCALDYPQGKLEIQVLDDSTDDTAIVSEEIIEEKKREGFHINHIRRDHRAGFKAGALAKGLAVSRGEFVAIFDADFVPPKNFLQATLPRFKDARVGLVQTRWGHLNADYSLLTRLQALFLDGHFLLEHTARNRSGAFFNFNGTAGIWRKKTITEAGGWSARTLTEDLDLSYRAQLKGWRFIFDPDFVCPAELPVDIHGFKSQQRRWTAGALQTARFLLKDLWRARIPLHAKIESTFHLTGNIGYLLTVVIALLLLPSLVVRGLLQNPWILLAEAAAFTATTVSISLFYAVSQRELYPDWVWRLKDIPALLSFGIGMCLNNAAAVLQGLFGNPSEFVRTPKYNILKKEDSWIKKSYRAGTRNWLLPAGLAAYSMGALAFALWTRNFGSIPFIFLFVFGFSYTAFLTLRHRPGR